MTLANKYIRYSPEITLEIFKLVWDKLIESGFKSRYNNKLYSEFDCFKSKHNYFIIDDICFNTHMSLYIVNGSETTVQEILGYDPFVNKEVIPEYVECMKVATRNTKIGEIFKCRHCNGSFEFEYNDKSGISYNSWDGWSCVWEDELPQKYFKPSTKEAFDAQNRQKSIEKWSVGSYVVFLNSEIQSNGFNKGDIRQIHEYNSLSITYYSGAGNTVSDKGISEQIKWFATKSEAEEFAKTLVEPVKEEYTLDMHEEMDKPLKQAVHCTTQEEWDFVTEKLGYKWSKYSEWSSYKNNTCIGLNKLGFGTAGVAYKGYQILSFQEWCDLNGYKMESNQEFKIGEYIFVMTKGGCYRDILKVTSVEPDEKDSGIKGTVWIEHENSSFSGGGFRLGSIYRYNEHVRHATPEEINNHLISIEQIPAGEPLNTGIEPNKDGMFKYTTYTGTTHVGKTSTISGPLKMTLSIDDEELPMINIIKTKTVNLLNLE